MKKDGGVRIMEPSLACAATSEEWRSAVVIREEVARSMLSFKLWISALNRISM
jgi:hypothetical protein